VAPMLPRAAHNPALRDRAAPFLDLVAAFW
jgi:hypothetical protein